MSCGSAPTSPAGTPPTSFLVISLDTTRADHLGAYGSSAGLTPNLDAFAKQAVVFDHAYAQANFTLMSHASLLTGRIPSELGRVSSDFHLGNSPETLAGVLSIYGFQTAAFTGGGQITEGYGLERGFSTYEVPVHMGLGSLCHTTPLALDWLDQHEDQGPFFLFVHGYDAHSPYLKPTPFGLALQDPSYPSAERPPMDVLLLSQLLYDHYIIGSGDGALGFRDRARSWDSAARSELAARLGAPGVGATRVGPADYQELANLYGGAVAWSDAWFGRFVRRLERSGVLDHTVVFVLADHGESLGEDGRFDHAHSLADRVLHVPLMVRLPGGRRGGSHVAPQVELVDVMPTALELAGIPPPAGLAGRSLVPWLEGSEDEAHSVVYSEGHSGMVSVRTETLRLVFAGVAAGSPYLPLLLESADIDGPAFEESSTTDHQRREALWQALIEVRRTLRPAPDQVEQADPGLVKAMQARGYWVRE